MYPHRVIYNIVQTRCFITNTSPSLSPVTCTHEVRRDCTACSGIYAACESGAMVAYEAK